MKAFLDDDDEEDEKEMEIDCRNTKSKRPNIHIPLKTKRKCLFYPEKNANIKYIVNER